MEIVASALGFALFLFTLVLFARMILGFVMNLSREWRPQGAMLVVTEAVFTVTDPPIKFLRRFIPPLQIGPRRVDVAFIVLLLACVILYPVLLQAG